MDNVIPYNNPYKGFYTAVIEELNFVARFNNEWGTGIKGYNSLTTEQILSIRKYWKNIADHISRENIFGIDPRDIQYGDDDETNYLNDGRRYDEKYLNNVLCYINHLNNNPNLI